MENGAVNHNGLRRPAWSVRRAPGLVTGAERLPRPTATRGPGWSRRPLAPRWSRRPARAPVV